MGDVRITGNGTPVQVTYRDVAGSSVSQTAGTLPWELSSGAPLRRRQGDRLIDFRAPAR